MLYTLGDKISYTRGLKEKKRIGEFLYKIGRKIIKGGPYPGGIVFLTRRDA
jgi:hypothetical protein